MCQFYEYFIWTWLGCWDFTDRDGACAGLVIDAGVVRLGYSKGCV